MTIPYLTVGNDELEGRPSIYKDDIIQCSHCDGTHKVALGMSRKWNNELQCLEEEETESNSMQFYSCSKTGKTYLCGVDNRAMDGVEVVK